MAIFQSDSIDLHFIDEGPRTGEPVLLVHGFASNLGVNWGSPGWIRALTGSGYRAIAFDHRGHGDSGKPRDPAAYSIEAMAGDALALLDSLGIGRADLIGYSMGARVSAWLGINHPGRVRSLVLGGMGANLFVGAPKADAIAAALEAETAEEIDDPYVRTFRRFADATGGDLKALAAVMRAPRAPIVAEDLARIACPVLLAVGTRDVVAGATEPVVAAIPDCTFVAIPNRDHNRAVGDRVFKDAALAFLDRRP